MSATRAAAKFHNLKTVRHKDGHLVATSRSGEIGVIDANGRERERYKIPYGATINIADGDEVKRRPAHWPSGIRTHIRSSPRSRAP